MRHWRPFSSAHGLRRCDETGIVARKTERQPVVAGERRTDFVAPRDYDCGGDPARWTLLQTFAAHQLGQMLGQAII